MADSQTRTYAWYIRQFEQARRDAEAFILPMEERLFRRRPDRKSWCVGECFSHLNAAGSAYLEKIHQGIERLQPREKIPDRPLDIRLHMKWFVSYLEPPVSLKSRAPSIFQPEEYAGIHKEPVLAAFTDLQQKLAAVMEKAQARHLDLTAAKVPNPYIGLLKMTPAECIAVVEAHQRRHFEQARKTLQEIS